MVKMVKQIRVSFLLLLHLYLCVLFLIACSKGTQWIQGEDSALKKATLPRAPVLLSINSDPSLEIHSQNVKKFVLKGQCSEEGQPIQLKIGVLDLSPLTCTNGAWSITLDLTAWNKISSIPLTGIHKSVGNKELGKLSTQLINHFVCPKGFIGVPPLKGYTNRSFCVAKYEMKNDGSNKVVSEAAQTPYVNLDREEAIKACKALAGSEKDHDLYNLITNDEWQTIARNIESVSLNWGDQKIGSTKGLNQGHSGAFEGPKKTLAASPNDLQGCFHMSQPCPGTSWNEHKRTHTLSNGEIIWDFSGNVSEWVKDESKASYGKNTLVAKLTVQTHNTLRSLRGGTTIVARMAKDQFGPLGNYASLIHGGLGAAVVDHKKGTVIRGGSFIDEKSTSSGVFSVFLSYSSKYKDSYLGFRCSYHPRGGSFEEEDS